MSYRKDELKFLREEALMLAKEFASDNQFVEDISKITGLRDKIVYVSDKITKRGYETFDRRLLMNTMVYLQEKHGIDMEMPDVGWATDEEVISGEEKRKYKLVGKLKGLKRIKK